jgi:hypothetical protein
MIDLIEFDSAVVAAGIKSRSNRDHHKFEQTQMQRTALNLEKYNVVGRRGIEPRTNGLRVHCST